MILPNRIYFTGLPGSKWSGISQIIEDVPGFNTTDRKPEREYTHENFSGHIGAYFGPGMEFEAVLDDENLDAPFLDDTIGTNMIKSHDWINQLEDVVAKCKADGDHLILVWRDVKQSYDWWLEAGGFDITYPSYEYYVDNRTMLLSMIELNGKLLNWTTANNVIFEEFDDAFMKKWFDYTPMTPVDTVKYKDIKVAYLKF